MLILVVIDSLPSPFSLSFSPVSLALPDVFWVFLVWPAQTQASCFKGTCEFREMNCSKNKVLPWKNCGFVFLKRPRKPPVIVIGD